MMYLLDTNTCIRYINGRSLSILEQMSRINDRDIVLNSVVQHELWFGAFRSKNIQRRMNAVNAFMSRFVSIPLDSRTAILSGYVRARLANAGTPIGLYNLLIAATGLQYNLIVVTHNAREFSRTDGLRMEDWEAE